MYISYSSSDSYAEYTGISMLSLFENNKDTKIDEVFLLDNGISSKNLKKICDIADRYERKLTIMDVSGTLEQYASETKLKKFNGSYSTYARLIPERIYPQYVDFLIIIDSDTIINKSIEHLPIKNLQEKVIAAIDNPEAHMNPSFLGIDDKEVLKKKGFYLNCGIMIFNIPKWRENKLPIRIKESILNIKEFRFVDQTIINYTMNRDEILFLELTFNSFFHAYPKYMVKYYIDRYFELGYKKEMLQLAAEDPCIIHYKGENVRPWNKQCFSRSKKIYMDYKKKSPWRNSEEKNLITNKMQYYIYIIKKIYRMTPLTILRKNSYLK